MPDAPLVNQSGVPVFSPVQNLPLAGDGARCCLWYQGYRCADDAPSGIYAVADDVNTAKVYKPGNYEFCIYFQEPLTFMCGIVAESLVEYEDCATCETVVGPCPTDNTSCDGPVDATFTWPETCEPGLDVGITLDPVGDGTWYWESELSDTTTATIECINDGAAWRMLYSNSTHCAGVTFTFTMPRTTNCPVGVWTFISETGVCCAPGVPELTTA